MIVLVILNSCRWSQASSRSEMIFGRKSAWKVPRKIPNSHGRMHSVLFRKASAVVYGLMCVVPFCFINNIGSLCWCVPRVLVCCSEFLLARVGDFQQCVELHSHMFRYRPVHFYVTTCVKDVLSLQSLFDVIWIFLVLVRIAVRGLHWASVLFQLMSIVLWHDMSSVTRLWSGLKRSTSGAKVKRNYFLCSFDLDKICVRQAR